MNKLIKTTNNATVSSNASLNARKASGRGGVRIL